ncbi:hypothetical protein [Kribbella sp. NPDC049584]|uniref:hypothetical protein n=1 Tax=Kribbella sp. NPDC049584 TaxID=3154833 RepID=UPI00344875C1
MIDGSSLARAVAAIKRQHEKFEGWSPRRPGRTMRLFALAGALFTAYGLTEANGWHDFASGASALVLLSLGAVAPRGLYDGRSAPWADRHKVLSWLLAAVFLGPAGFLAVSAFVDDWKFGLFVMIPVAALTVASLIASRRGVNTDEGSSSGLDDDPSVLRRSGGFED